jgi:hypothetical protein
MKALAFYKAVTMDETALLDRVIELLERERIPYCVIGGQAVNAYVEPLVSLDVDIAIAAGSVDTARASLESHFRVVEFPHSLNVAAEGSDLRLQIQKDPRYSDFVPRAERRPVLGMELRVAAVRDVMQGKVWAASDPERRPSKRQKDLADIARLLESYPELASLVPEAISRRLEAP